MSRWFNTAGPCKANKHYMLPPTSRLPDLGTIIEQESYFVVHAPRQTGKTTAMLALAKQLTQSGRYIYQILVSPVAVDGFPGISKLANPKGDSMENHY